MDNVKKDCYALVQEIVCARDIFCRGPQCCAPTTVGHHLYSRDNLATAFNTKYVIGFCHECHTWSHQNPAIFLNWLLNTMGDQYYVGLRLSHTVVKHMDFYTVRENLKKELEFVKKT